MEKNRRPRYPIGIQTFSKIIEEGYMYVDKTFFIGRLVEEGSYYFLSRPRRFGKSLLLSTMRAYFEGRRHLFKGLALDQMDVDWTPSPVIHLDFNAENYQAEDGLQRFIDSTLASYEAIYGRREVDVTPAQRLGSLIRNAHSRHGQKVVILVDEYDKPLLALEDNKPLFEKNQAILKGMFANLKSMDAHIRFAFLTGVARFNKVSIFSDLNNLDDISLSEDYADICGLTEKELTDSFQAGIQNLAAKREEAPEETLAMLRDYYDGYLFHEGGSRLYNPFSVLSALRKESIQPYWFETGTPTFLVKRIKRSGMDPSALDGQKCGRETLLAVGFDMKNPIGLMFQTGYLTIASYDRMMEQYTLRFPNREVEIGLAQSLAPLYIPDSTDSDSHFSIYNFKEDLYGGRPQAFMKRLETLLKSMPGEDHSESTYRAIVYLLCTLASAPTEAEHRSYRGRSDLEVATPGYVYIFEFKYRRSAKEAMEQLLSRDYGGRHALDSRPRYLIGANFSDRHSTPMLTYEIVGPMG